VPNLPVAADLHRAAVQRVHWGELRERVLRERRLSARYLGDGVRRFRGGVRGV
jgi:hypothetical protein